MSLQLYHLGGSSPCGVISPLLGMHGRDGTHTSLGPAACARARVIKVANILERGAASQPSGLSFLHKTWQSERIMLQVFDDDAAAAFLIFNYYFA